MPSKLKFKGEKKRKRREEGEDPQTEKKVQLEGWMTATEETHLQGPVMIVVDEDGGPTCLCSDADGKIYTSQELEQVNDEGRAVDRIEPSSSQQVFVIVRLDNGKAAFKTSAGKYLSIRDGRLNGRSGAMGDREFFDLQDGWYISQGDKYIQVDEDKLGDRKKLTLRVQAVYAMAAKNAEPVVQTRISTKQLEEKVGRKLNEREVKTLKRAFKDGKLNEALLDVRQSSRHDTRC